MSENINISLVKDSEIVHKGVSIREKYEDAIKPIVDWIKKNIADSPTNEITITVADLVNQMGVDFIPKKTPTIHRRLKLILSKENIEIFGRIMKTGERAFVFREKNTT